MIKIFFTAVLLASSGIAWCQNSAVRNVKNTNFDFVITESVSPKTVSNFNAIFFEDLAMVEGKLSFFLQSKTTVFLLTSDTDIAQWKSKSSRFNYTNAGITELENNKVFINLNNPPFKQRQDFRFQIAQILIANMLYGNAIQDKIKHSNMIYLESWVTDGLAHYLATDWDQTSDNLWRNIFLKNTSINLNKKLAKDMEVIKGASFWHYLYQEYGGSVIPSVLFTAKLTRKLPSAIYYTTKKSIRMVSKDWMAFYQNAYQIDLQKVLPVGGFEIKEGVLWDYEIIDSSAVLILVRKNGNFVLYKQNTLFNTLEKIGKYPENYSPLPAFMGSIITQKKQPFLVLQNANLTYLKALSGKNIMLPFSNVVLAKMVNQGLLVVDRKDDIDALYLYSIERKTSEALLKSNDRITGVDMNSTGEIVLVKEDFDTRYLVLSNKKYGIDTLLTSIHELSYPVFFNDSTLLFGHNISGINNGCMLPLSEKKPVFLTDYALSIGAVKLKKNILIESMQVANTTLLFATLWDTNLKDIFSYTGVSSSYFFNKKTQAPVKDESIKLHHSLLFDTATPPYTFQVPFPKALDYVDIKVDSLQQNQSSSKRDFIGSSKKILTLSSTILQVHNQDIYSSATFFRESIEAYLPNRLRLTVGATFSDVLRKNMLHSSLTLFPIRGNMEMTATVLNNPLGLSLTGWRGKRRMVYIGGEQKLFDYITNVWEVEKNWTKQKSIVPNISQSIRYRSDGYIHQLTDTLFVGTRGQKNDIISLPVMLSWKFDLGTNQAISIATVSSIQWQSTAGRRAINNHITVGYRYATNGWFVLSSQIRAGNSTGTSAEIYVLGGHSYYLSSQPVATAFNPQMLGNIYLLKYGLRGVPINFRNGNTYFNYNIDAEFYPLKVAVRKPLWRELSNHLNFQFFSDGGLAFYGKSMYDINNIYAFQTIDSPQGYSVKVRNFNNPFVVSGGIGIGSEIYKYAFGVQYAKALVFNEFLKGQLYFTLGKRF